LPGHPPQAVKKSAVEPEETADFAEATINISRLSSVSEQKPVIPGYVLGEKLGQGAFGAAYRSVQEKTGQSVAVKVLTRVGPRFREEVNRLSLVSDHPHIVTLVDADLDHDPPYLVTPLLSGSLADEIPTRPEDARVETVCKWLRELATALEFIHGRGILHCDLKPANILIGEEGFVRLTDFGQAALQNQEQSHLGSFWFMPWQQTEGGLPEIKWDVYALGATVYALLTGHPPHFSKKAHEDLKSRSAVSEKLLEYRRVVRNTSLTPVRDLNPGVDGELAAIVEHCLDSENGYTNASELLADLDRRERRMPLAARTFSYRYSIERFIARHRLSFVVAVMALSILLTGLGVSSYQVFQARQARNSLIEQQYEVGRSLLNEGQTRGLVWLARAYQLEPKEEFRKALLEALSQQRQITLPFLYGLRTMTAPSPSGNFAIWKNRNDDFKKNLVDLRNGSIEPLSEGVFGSVREQKDKVRYRLDGIELDPHEGRGGPATWRIRSIDSLQPGEDEGSLAILVQPEKVWRAQRSQRGIEILDDQGHLIREIQREGQAPVQPTFSREGDLAVSWEDGRTDWYRNDGTKMTDETFYGDLFCFSDDGRYLAASDGISRLRVWDKGGGTVAEFPITAAANEICFNRASNFFVCVTRDGLVRGYSLETKSEAWPPLELQKPARWVYIQENGQVVTMSDEVIVWKEPEPLDFSLQDSDSLNREIARRTGWVYDERTAQIRTLSRSEYQALFSP
jgi:serine/threonine protein kinase